MAKAIPHKVYSLPKQKPREWERYPEKLLRAKVARRSPLNDSQRPGMKGRKT